MLSNEGEILNQRLVRPLIWSILAGVIIYGGSMVFSDLHAVGESIARLGASGWLIVLGLSLLNYGLRFVRWQIYLNRFRYRIHALRSLAYYLGGFAFTTTPGKAGEAMRSLYLKRHGVTYVHSLAAFFTERLVDLVAMVLLALVAALEFPDYQWPVVVIMALLLVLLLIVHARPFHSFVGAQLQRLPSEKIRTLGLRLLELLRSASTLLWSGPLYAGIALAVLAWGAEGIAFHVILQTLDIHAPVALAVGIYSVSVLVGALSFIPGGLGSTEAVMVLLLKLVGADTATALAATLICRLATLWFAVMIGGLTVLLLEVQAKAARRQVSNI